MIDTVTLSLADYCLKSENRFEYQPPRINCFGEPLSREKVFLNLPHFNVDIGLDKRLYIKTSLPHLVFGTSLFEIGENHFEQIIGIISDKLLTAGVDFSKDELIKAPLSRIDFCRNLAVSYPICDYISQLSRYRASRRDTIDWKHETVSFRNRQRELVAYNKIRQIKSIKGERELARGLAENILRVESRYRTGKAVKKHLPFVTFEVAFSEKLAKEILIKEFDSLIAPKESSQLELDFSANSQLLESIKRTQYRNSFSRFLAVKGIDTFLAEFRYDFDLIKEFLSLHYNKSRVYEILSEIRELQNLAIKKESRDLIGEIRYKLAA